MLRESRNRGSVWSLSKTLYIVHETTSRPVLILWPITPPVTPRKYGGKEILLVARLPHLSEEECVHTRVFVCLQGVAESLAGFSS